MSEKLDLNNLLENLVKNYGYEYTLSQLKLLDIQYDENVITIVSNVGLHPLPAELIRGELIQASKGNLDFSSGEAALADIIFAIQNIHAILHKKRPRKVYLIPWGPAALSCHIKHMVYKTLGIETIDVLYLGEGRYIDLDISSRSIISSIFHHD